jgi:predicted Zn-dependent protease
MKRRVAFTGIVLLGFAALFLSENRKVDAQPSASALLFLIGDTEQELTRMPVRFTRMSDSEEIAIGNDMARAYGETRQQKRPEDIEVENYLSHIGATLASGAHRKLPYRFHYVSDEYLINAFALPGGHIYVGQGLLELMDSEDELASVLGHEIEHIDHYHCAERVQQEQALRKIPFGELVALPIEVFQAGYSKDEELEADREGTQLAVQAGYSANGAIRMFETFQRLYEEYQTHARSPQQELAQVAVEGLGGYFRTHPPASERIAQIKTLIAARNWPVHAERDLAVAYMTWNNRSAEALSRGNYDQAKQLAKRSLLMHPKQERALDLLARAQFAQAEFGDAAQTFRQLLDLEITDGLVESYAMALAGSNRASASGLFRQWVDQSAVKTRHTDVTEAGLDLLAGSPLRARQLASELRGHPLLAEGPGEQADLGWWFYLAGDYQSAVEMLSDAVQQRPGDLTMATHYSWALLELRRYNDALENLNRSYGEGAAEYSRTMAEAVVLWNAQQPAEALGKFSQVSAQQPEWKNSRWIAAMYSPTVVNSIEAMRKESDRLNKVRQQSQGR